MQAHATPAVNTAMYPCGTIPGLAIIDEEAAVATLAFPHGDRCYSLPPFNAACF